MLMMIWSLAAADGSLRPTSEFAATSEQCTSRLVISYIMIVLLAATCPAAAAAAAADQSPRARNGVESTNCRGSYVTSAVFSRPSCKLQADVVAVAVDSEQWT